MAKGGARRGSGPKPTPTRLRALRGAKRKNLREPQLEAEVPKPPKWISKLAAEEWEHLVEILEPMHVLSRAESRALALVAEALADYRSATSASVRDRAWRRAFSGLAEFGLTPSSRTRLMTRELPTADEKSDARKFMEEA